MAKAIALEARVAMSKPERRLILGDRDGPVLDRPDWLSLDVQVQFELGDGRGVSAPEPTYAMGGPLDCTRRGLEDRVRALIFQEPPESSRRHPAMQPRDELPQLVAELDAHGIETTLETLADLPLSFVIDDEVAEHLTPY
jgi:hypothetical protein